MGRKNNMVTVVTVLMKQNESKDEILKAVHENNFKFKGKKITQHRLNFTIKGILAAGIVDSYKPSKIWDKKRQADIKEMLENGERLVTIAKKYGFSKARAMQISQTIGINPKDVRQKQRETLAKQIKADVKTGASYCAIKSKYNLRGRDLNYLTKVVKNFDCTFTTTTNKRNEKIINTFSKGVTAKSIVKTGLCNVGTVGGVYQILRSAGVKRYPHIKRNKGGWNDDPKVMALIKEYSDTGFTASDIAKILNKKGLKTLQGVYR